MTGLGQPTKCGCCSSADSGSLRHLAILVLIYGCRVCVDGWDAFLCVFGGHFEEVGVARRVWRSVGHSDSNGQDIAWKMSSFDCMQEFGYASMYR